ncbi:hypothetical protein KPL71_023882 [Citrus sinensis]|uniref:Uncharacterized protein n=1 Tax=Citrus sinensis TaxID=2711 RepID=A0ACB8IMF5_CITSI|nr:hypothetical protein KPL71_023882 [Citrus sinensis]
MPNNLEGSYCLIGESIEGAAFHVEIVSEMQQSIILCPGILSLPVEDRFKRLGGLKILRQIPRHELIQLMPLEWISNYEQFHNNTAPIQTSESMFERRQDGTVRMNFKPPPSAPQEPPRLSFTYSSMITTVQTTQEDLPITGFNSEGYPVYPAKHNGHFLWDVPGSGMCDPTCPCWDHSSYFPPLEPHTDSQRNVVSKPFIPSPITSTSHLEPPKPFESVLNWQTQNARAQNDTLLHLNSKVEKSVCELNRLRQRDNPLPPPPTPKPKSKPRPVKLYQPPMPIPDHQSPGYMPASPSAPPPTQSQPPTQSKDKDPMHQFTAHAVAHSSNHSSTIDDQTSYSNLAVSDSHTETDTESSTSTSDSEKSYADITKILMAQPDQTTQGQTSHTEPYVDIPSEVDEEMPESSATNQPPSAQTQTNPPSQKSSNGPWFTFDDLPYYKWRDRLNEMSAWIDLQMLRPGATTESVLREYATRFTGALRDWFDSLGQYRQLQFVQLPEVSSALAVIHDQFLGDPSAFFEATRRDYLNMKCCSLNAKDLDFHYKRMSLLFYKLNGFNEPTLKHVFLASLPEELQPDIQRQLTASNLSLDNISLGKIFQLAKTCLDKLCEQKQFFKELLKDRTIPECLQKALFADQISRKPYRIFRKKSSSSRDFTRQKSSRCFICRKKGHYAKYCPNKRQKSIRLVEHLQAITDYSPEQDELEFYFPEQDEPNDDTVFALQNSSDDSDRDQFQALFHQQLLSIDTTVPIPSIKLQILPSKFQRPIPAIGLIDTGSHDEHRQLLTQFYDIIQSHGIMLSAKKSTIATDNIEFLDASNESWGAILLEELNEKEHFIAYASGQFSDTQKHYHSVFKEILAVKNGIKKFEYHLIGHHFLIRMDSSAFPNILNFKGLTLDPSKETTEDVLWYVWCLTVLYATKLILPISPTLENLLNPDKATSLTWTLLEWFSPIPWWRKKLQQLSKIYNLERSLSQPSSSQPSKADKATQMPSPTSQPSPSKPGYRRDCPYPPCRGPQCKHPKLSKIFFPTYTCDTDPDETESSSEDDYMNLRSP